MSQIIGLGGKINVLSRIIMFLWQVFILHGVSLNVFASRSKNGIGSMLPAVYILLFAWTIVDLIGRLGNVPVFGWIVQDLNLNAIFPSITFIFNSWINDICNGHFMGIIGILLPIAGEITAATDISMILPAMAAVLAGAVFGDHCSPISDTTILSSTGAMCEYIDHVMTQIPYALISAGIAW